MAPGPASSPSPEEGALAQGAGGKAGFSHQRIRVVRVLNETVVDASKLKQPNCDRQIPLPGDHCSWAAPVDPDML